MLIVNARLYTMAGTYIENGYLRTEGTVIAELGPMPADAKPNEEVIDAQGAALYPGFVDAHTHLGMWEDGLTFEGDDGNEETDPVTPQLRAIDAINPVDRCFREALGAGITTVVTGPGSANAIGGQMAAIKTYGNCIDRMIVKAPFAIKMALGENPKTVYHGKNQTPSTRMATTALIREQLYKAKRYQEELERAEKDEDFDRPEFDIKCEALLPALRREIQVHFHAHRADDIFTAVRIAKEFQLAYVVIHGTESHVIVDGLVAVSYTHLVAMITIPAGLGLSVLSGPITQLLGYNEITGKILILLGLGAIFAATDTPINSMLQAVGRVDLPIKLLSVGLIIKVVLNYFLVGIPEINVMGAGIGTLVCYLFLTVFGLVLLLSLIHI